VSTVGVAFNQHTDDEVIVDETKKLEALTLELSRSSALLGDANEAMKIILSSADLSRVLSQNIDELLIRAHDALLEHNLPISFTGGNNNTHGGMASFGAGYGFLQQHLGLSSAITNESLALGLSKLRQKHADVFEKLDSMISDCSPYSITSGTAGVKENAL
jgi:hypothetical protein